jgi:hypothetical protein
MTITAGTCVGRYEIRSPIGRGGMGEVYLSNQALISQEASKMPRYNVTRTLPPLTSEELNDVGKKVVSVCDQVGMQWIRSHVTASRTTSA